MKQTAVDYLVKAWVEQGTLYAEDIVKAKEIEKQQIMKAVFDSMCTNIDPNMGRAEQYYNEIYK